jgi:hypothetical protein
MGRGGWLILALVLVIIGGYVTLLVRDHVLRAPKTFNAEQWRAGDTREHARMVGDLNRNGTLVGKSWDEVVALLGPPDRGDRGRLEYDFVSGDSFFDLSELLCLNFDETGRVREVTFFD